jgi:hypothetical protein
MEVQMLQSVWQELLIIVINPDLDEILNENTNVVFLVILKKKKLKKRLTKQIKIMKKLCFMESFNKLKWIS